MSSIITCLCRLIGFITILLVTSNLNGQSINGRLAQVSNIRVEMDTARVKIRYDVSGLVRSDSVYIQVESRIGNSITATAVTGDVGQAISSGTGKTIYWDYRLEGLTIVDEIRVMVLVKQAFIPGQRIALGGGPANALISALVPGLGTIFVQANRKIGVRPLITVAYGGLLIYGLVQRNKSQQQFALYQNQLSESVYTEANQLHHQYLLAVRAAAVVWVADVVYTFLKGRKNEREKSGVTHRLVFNYVNQTPMLGMQLRF